LQKLFKRKLTDIEVEGSFICLPKGELSKFPPPRIPFILKIGKREFETYIDTLPCGSGPCLYRIEACKIRKYLGFKTGKIVSIKRNPNGIYEVVK
jgi:hypothetical protein